VSSTETDEHSRSAAVLTVSDPVRRGYGFRTDPLKVAFQLFGGEHWAGGIHYLRNLLSALYSLPDSPVQVGLVVESTADNRVVEQLRPFLHLPLVRLRPPFGGGAAVRKVLTFALQRDPIARGALRAAGIDVLFQNTAWYGSRLGIPTVAWIPDFQHRHLPHMFSRFAWLKREVGFQALTRTADVVMLSSNDSRKDCERYYPSSCARICVLPFAVEFPAHVLRNSSGEIRMKYGLPEKYLFFPGQLYRHKNHLNVIRAVRLLRDRGKRIVVAFSGTEDPRNRGHAMEVARAIEHGELQAEVRPLGFIAYDEMLQLMREAVAVLNASLFEGWSTTVEEAKAIGAPLVLSNLDVHREQAGPVATFFDAQSPGSIADAMSEVWNGAPGPRPEQEARAVVAARARRQEFARGFVDIARRAQGARR
jgi:glycosyltransferase involved in cell wall biosynthesis